MKRNLNVFYMHYIQAVLEVIDPGMGFNQGLILQISI